jgi:thiamine-phosphate pyrophosphorylase
LLYAVIDKETCRNNSVIGAAGNAIAQGADIIQLRDKISNKKQVLEYANSISKLAKSRKKLFIINDFIDIAKIADCDGVHLGQDDMPIEAARKILGKQKLVGISCHSPKQAVSAQNKGADYIGIGPIFATPTKPKTLPIGLKTLREINKLVQIPYFAIGGININTIRQIIDNGAKRIAVVRAANHGKKLKDILGKNLKRP